MQRLKSTTVYPFLLNIFEDCYMYRNINIQMMCKTLDIILSYVMRRLLCEMPTNALNKVFASMMKDIERYEDKELCEKVALVLAGKKATEIYEKYVHCIGNLTLTDYNSEMSNDSFEEKR